MFKSDAESAREFRALTSDELERTAVEIDRCICRAFVKHDITDADEEDVALVREAFLALARDEEPLVTSEELTRRFGMLALTSIIEELLIAEKQGRFPEAITDVRVDPA